MLTYNMSQNENQPLYLYLYNCIREDILCGVLQAGQKLPSKRSLARHLNVSVITVENAYSQLLMEGYIHSVEKSGYYINELEYTERSAISLPPQTPEEEFEYSFFADLRSNRIRRNHFPFSTWAKLMRNVLSEQKEMLLKTVPYNGIYELRLAIAQFLHSYRGMSVLPSQIIIGAGTEFLYSRLFMLFGPDAVWGVEKIGNQKITHMYDTYQARWNYISMDEDGPVPGQLTRKKCNILHVSPAHHFPTGNIMPIKRRQELLKWSTDLDNRYIIEDDYDSEFRYSGKVSATLYSMDSHNRVIYMNTFSKTLIPSLRISYMVLPPDLMQKYTDMLSFYSGTVPSMEQYALARFLSEGYFERHLNHMKIHYRSQRDKLIQAIRQSPLGAISTIEETAAGTHFLLKLQTDKPDSRITADARSQNIDVASLSEYQADHRDDTHTLIINYSGIHTERIDETVNRLYRAVSEP